MLFIPVLFIPQKGGKESMAKIPGRAASGGTVECSVFEKNGGLAAASRKAAALPSKRN
jgi:hypothetical protein